jgi:predicted RNase H-like nuclease (RuvC/YqgF family)
MTYETILSIYNDFKRGSSDKELQKKHLTATNVIDTIVVVYESVSKYYNNTFQELQEKIKKIQKEKESLEKKNDLLKKEIALRPIDEIKEQVTLSHQTQNYLELEEKLKESEIEYKDLYKEYKDLEIKYYKLPDFIRSFFN